jgi:hypothetical protein
MAEVAQDVTFEDQIVLEDAAGSKVFTFESAPLENDTVGGGQIYSQPLLDVWDHSLNETVSSQPASSRPNRFLSGGSILQGIIEVRSSFLPPSYSEWRHHKSSDLWLQDVSHMATSATLC